MGQVLSRITAVVIEKTMDFVHKVVDTVTGHHAPAPAPATIVKIKGTAVLIKAAVLDFTDFSDSILDRVHELLGNGVSFQLVSATVADAAGKGKTSKAAYLEEWVTTLTSLNAGESRFNVTFEWDTSLGIPGAVLVRNNHHAEFLLKTLTLEGVPGPRPRLHFVCNSWVYSYDKYNYDRVFFVNDTLLPEQVPAPLRMYVQDDLEKLRGDGVTRKLEEWDRIYGYAYYNDLGMPDSGENLARPVLGGSKEYPYPRRGKTNRPPSKKDPHTESRLNLVFSLNIYVPRDERFGHIKMSDFLAYALKALGQGLLPAIDAFGDSTPNEFDSFEEILGMYEGGIKIPQSGSLDALRNLIPFEIIKEITKTDDAYLLKLPLPQVISVDKTAWRTDDEFGREMLAGVNPVIVSRLKVFPPVSKLDSAKYGNQNSSLTAEDIEKNLEGLTVEQALHSNRLFILDHHDALMPYLTRINATSNKIYASRTILLLKEDGTLKPVAIELSLPHPDGDSHGAVSRVFTPAEDGVEGSVWQLAKAYAAVDDSGYHQLISHWLNTHAAIEPFVIATHRQLSVLHPVHKLLHPHFRDTMNINALARQILINAGGVLEKTVFPDKYAMEMSSVVYKNWKLTDQALPQDLINRGIAVEDSSAPHKLRLLIEDYPYAVDGLSIWYAIEDWVREYCTIYYPSDSILQKDTELQAWWKEIREVGHGDKKDEPWWPKMDKLSDLVQSCTTIIWVASALHAAVNFGQYPYAGYLPNRPTISRRFMPVEGTPEYAEIEKDFDMVFLKTITAQIQTVLGVSLIEILSRHSSDEVYLGQRDTPEWTSDLRAVEAFQKFGNRLVGIENKIMEMNADEKLKNRNGPVKVPYTLLYPNTSDLSGAGGLTGKGIPNSVSI